MISIQQAAANASATFIQSKMPDVAVSSRWPGKEFPDKAITIIIAGSRRDQTQEPRILSKTNQGANETSVVWQVAEVTQPFQLDVWAKTYMARDDMMARLDRVLRAGYEPLGTINRDPFANYFYVNVLDGWDVSETTARFTFDSPDWDDTPDTVGRAQFRATYRGLARMKLTFTAVSPRQKTINLAAFLDGVREDTEIT